MTAAQVEREVAIAALFGSSPVPPRVFRVRIRARMRNGDLFRFRIDETGRAFLIGCSPAFLQLYHSGCA